MCNNIEPFLLSDGKFFTPSDTYSDNELQVSHTIYTNTPSTPTPSTASSIQSVPSDTNTVSIGTTASADRSRVKGSKLNANAFSSKTKIEGDKTPVYNTHDVRKKLNHTEGPKRGSESLHNEGDGYFNDVGSQFDKTSTVEMNSFIDTTVSDLKGQNSTAALHNKHFRENKGKLKKCCAVQF